jgi:hypothetical protein
MVYGDAADPYGLAGEQLRWVCGATPHPVDGRPAARCGEGEAAAGGTASDVGPLIRFGRVIARRRSAEPGKAEAAEPGLPEAAEIDSPEAVAVTFEAEVLSDEASGCEIDPHGWIAPHRHGAVRPRARAARRERPPDRWC